MRAHFDAGVGLQSVSLSPNQKYAALACRTHVQVLHLRNQQESQSDVKGNDPQAINPLLQLQLSQAGEKKHHAYCTELLFVCLYMSGSDTYMVILCCMSCHVMSSQVVEVWAISR